MATSRLYLSSNSTVGSGVITGVYPGERPAVTLDRTHFHPQGGGQQADLGWIGGFEVEHVEYDRKSDEVLHFLSTLEGFRVGQEVKYRVRADTRMLASRLHTAGHLIAPLAVALDSRLQPKAGHHWPGEARVDFKAPEMVLDSFADLLETSLAEAISEDLRVRITSPDATGRMVQIGSLKPMPCGGCHVRSLSELASVRLRKVKYKKGMLRIGYDVELVTSSSISPDGIDCLPPTQVVASQ